MIPLEYQGVWRRESITVGDGPPIEPAQVDWLQGPSAFADLRLPNAPGDPALCFAGTTTHAGARLTWHHDLDLGVDVGADTGMVEWDGGDLVERGVFLVDGVETPYVEVWRREAPIGDGIALVRRDERGVVRGRSVRIGNECLVVDDDRATAGTFIAARLQREPSTGVWSVVRSLGNPSMRTWCTGEAHEERAGWEIAEVWGQGSRYTEPES